MEENNFIIEDDGKGNVTNVISQKEEKLKKILKINKYLKLILKIMIGSILILGLVYIFLINKGLA